MKQILRMAMRFLIPFILSKVMNRKKTKSSQPEKHLTEKQQKNRQKNSLPNHKMLDHLVKGLIISPALGKEIPSIEIISDFETEIDWKFPKQYTDFQLKYGSVFFRVDENIWPKAKTGSVVPFWATNYGFIIYGYSNGGPDWSDLKRKYNQFKEHFPDLPFFIPIHRLVAGDQTYIGFDKDGNLVEAVQHANKLRPIQMDFDSFVTSEVKELKTRMDRRVEYNKTGEWPNL